MYVVNRKSSQLFRLASQFGCVSDMSYIAMYYYKTLRYREAVSVLEKTKEISLEILGICQHNAGDLQAAHFSYHQARRQIQYNKIGAANRQRMVDLNLPTFDADTRYSQREKHTVRNGLYYTVTYHDYS